METGNNYRLESVGDLDCRREGLEKELTDWPCTDKILHLAVSINRWEADWHLEYKVGLKIFR